MNDESSFQSAAAGMSDGMARICRLYGVSPLMGRLYSVLFLAVRPLALDALVTQTGAAKSSVSVALRKLASARVVRRLPPRLDRRDHYECIADPWAIFADWTTLFVAPELQMFRETGGQVETALSQAGDAPAPEEAALIRERLAAFREFSDVLTGMLQAVNRAPQAPTPARRIPIDLGGPR